MADWSIVELKFVAAKLVEFVREHDLSAATTRLRGAADDKDYEIRVEVRHRTKGAEAVTVKSLPGDHEMRMSGGTATPTVIFEGRADWLAQEVRP